jgi:hypothetical protein
MHDTIPQGSSRPLVVKFADERKSDRPDASARDSGFAGMFSERYPGIEESKYGSHSHSTTPRSGSVDLPPFFSLSSLDIADRSANVLSNPGTPDSGGYARSLEGPSGRILT